MPAGYFPIVVEAGVDFELGLELHNPDGTPLDLTGFSAEFTIRSDEGVELALSNSIMLEGNVIRIDSPASETAALNWDAAWYDLVLIGPDNDQDSVLHGPAKLREAARQ